MRSLIIIAFLFIIGCRKEKLPPQQFVLSGVVRLNKEIHENAKVEFEVCKHTKWIKDKKWVTRTDKWGRYRVVATYIWFGKHYRIRAILYDKYGNLHVSDWEYGVVKFGAEERDIWVGEKEPEEEKKRRRRRRRRRF